MTDAQNTPPPGEGDDKDWTWVLERPCPECGFVATTFDRSDVARMLRDNAAEWVDILSGEPDDVRTRRDPGVWSALEYGCHVRDVHVLYLERLELMLNEVQERLRRGTIAFRHKLRAARNANAAEPSDETWF